MVVMMAHGLIASTEHVLPSLSLELPAKVYTNSYLHKRYSSLAQNEIPSNKLNCTFPLRGLRVCDHMPNASVYPCSVLRQFASQYGNATPNRIMSQAGRRHHRRRGQLDRRPLNSKILDSKNRGDDKVEITLDFQELKQRAGEAAATTKNSLASSLSQARQAGKTFIQDGKQAWKELRSSVAVQNDKRVVIAVKRSTLEFAGRTLVWTVLTVVLARFILICARRFRWGWEEGFNWPNKFRVRDRSLGGKEVVVSQGIKLWEGGPVKKAFRRTAKGLSPLDTVVATSRSEKELQRLKIDTDPLKYKRIQRDIVLPAWWPSVDQAPIMPPQACELAQREVHILLQDMLEKRISGVDFGEQDICKLRQLCRDSGAKVSFDTTNTRDAFYRAAIQVVLNACSSTGLLLELGNENPEKFIAGLAGNIGLKAEKASTMVIASVAARTRAGFLQAWALHMQGDAAGADEELKKLVRIHATFSPNPNSPEMELVGRGLSYFGPEERQELLAMYVRVGGSKTERIAREALSLVSNMDIKV